MEKRKGLWIIILIVVIVILLALLVNPIRNFMIILDLQNKSSEYKVSNNYHIKTLVTQIDGVTITTDYYNKDSKRARFTETDNSGEISRLLMYDTGKRIDMFIETKDEKTFALDTGMFMELNITNGLETDNAMQTFLACFSATIKEVEYKDKVCYSIENFFTPNAMYGLEKNESYIDKETGLEVFNNTDGVLTEKEYEFDNVEDLIFVEPNIGEYTLKTN